LNKKKIILKKKKKKKEISMVPGISFIK